LGRLAGGLSIKGECDGRMVSPYEACLIREHIDCQQVIEELVVGSGNHGDIMHLFQM